MAIKKTVWKCDVAANGNKHRHVHVMQYVLAANTRMTGGDNQHRLLYSIHNTSLYSTEIILAKLIQVFLASKYVLRAYFKSF
jgi:hypothetical protein